MPKTLTETCGRLTGLAVSASFQEFDAAVRESYPSHEDFAKAFDRYTKARKLRDRAFDLSQARDYLSGACDIDDPVDVQRDLIKNFFEFDALLADPAIIPVRLQTFEKWKTSYVHSYRKAHRAYYKKLDGTGDEPGYPETQGKGACQDEYDRRARAAAPHNATAWLLIWQPSKSGSMFVLMPRRPPSKALLQRAPNVHGHRRISRLPPRSQDSPQLVASGLADRFQRFKDAAISSILKKAAEQGDRPDLTKLLEIVQLTNADALAGVLTDDLVDFLRKLLYDENLVQEEIHAWPNRQRCGRHRRRSHR